MGCGPFEAGKDNQGGSRSLKFLGLVRKELSATIFSQGTTQDAALGPGVKSWANRAENWGFFFFPSSQQPSFFPAITAQKEQAASFFFERRKRLPHVKKSVKAPPPQFFIACFKPAKKPRGFPTEGRGKKKKKKNRSWDREPSGGWGPSIPFLSKTFPRRKTSEGPENKGAGEKSPMVQLGGFKLVGRPCFAALLFQGRARGRISPAGRPQDTQSPPKLPPTVDAKKKKKKKTDPAIPSLFFFPVPKSTSKQNGYVRGGGFPFTQQALSPQWVPFSLTKKPEIKPAPKQPEKKAILSTQRVSAGSGAKRRTKKSIGRFFFFFFPRLGNVPGRINKPKAGRGPGPDAIFWGGGPFEFPFGRRFRAPRFWDPPPGR